MRVLDWLRRSRGSHGGAVGARRKRKVRRITAALLVIGLVGLGLGFGVPHAMVAIGSSRSEACLATYEQPRADLRPDCGAHVEWFVLPSRLPWMPVARYRGEEALARVAIANHLDAAVARPDRSALASATEALAASAQAMQRGSQRLVLVDIGPEVGVPNLGRMVDFVGDRKTLVARAPEWLDWSVRLHAIEASLLDEGLDGAIAIAKRYAAWDPRDEDLRTALAALLCLGDDAKRGLVFLETMQNDRASRRYAGMARRWGDVRVLMVACAARAGIEPPPKPEGGDAGTGEPLSPRAVLRLRLGAAAPATDPKATASRREALDAASQLLNEPPNTRSTRIALLTAILDASKPTPAEILKLLGMREGDLAEKPLEPPLVVSVFDVLDERRGVRPIVSADALEHAADQLAATPSTSGRERILSTAAALWIEAAEARAREGHADAAANDVDRAAALVSWDPLARAIARSSMWYAALHPARALAELEDAGVGAPGGAPAEPVARVRWGAALVQRAELLASLGRAADAADAAVSADEAAATTDDAALDAHARWTRLALARPEARLRKGDPVANGAWPWVGFADVAASWTEAGHVGRALAESVAVWSAALDAPADQRLAVRYRALRRRGDAPTWHVPHLVAASLLAREAKPESVEMWLDAFYAIDARRVTLRTYAWSRAEAARWRGDEVAAKTWASRYQALRDVAADPARADLAAALGL